MLNVFRADFSWPLLLGKSSFHTLTVPSVDPVISKSLLGENSANYTLASLHILKVPKNV